MASELNESTLTRNPRPDREMERLRSLILGADYEQSIQTLQSSDAVSRVADVLPEAIRLRGAQDESIQNALAPAIDDVLDVAIRRDPERLAQVIAPVIGPSIRAAVRSALADMVESLNRMLERSINPMALIWRVQAWRAGMPFGQFLLLKTLRYRVEQVLVIHRTTSILLHSESCADVDQRDPDLVSAMLSAINDFVTDSFRSAGDHANIKRVRFGDRLLFIEVGAQVIVAAVVLGDAPPALSVQLQQTLEQVQRMFGNSLTHFKGDRKPFAALADVLKDCLIEQSLTQQPRRRPWLAYAALFALTGIAGFFSWQQWQWTRQQDAIVAQLKSSADYVVLNDLRDGARQTVQVLSRFGSPPPRSIIDPASYPDVMLTLSSRPVAMDQQDLVVPYVERRFQLGMQVAVSVNNNVLTLSGPMSQLQLDQLQADGWLRQQVGSIDIQGVTLLPPPDQLALTRRNWLASIDQVQGIEVEFPENASSLTLESTAVAAQMVQQLQSIAGTAAQLGVAHVQFVIIGFADESGSSGINDRLSSQRAQTIRQLLVDNGVAPGLVVGLGAGSLGGSNLAAQQKRIAIVKILHDGAFEADTL